MTSLRRYPWGVQLHILKLGRWNIYLSVERVFGLGACMDWEGSTTNLYVNAACFILDVERRHEP